MATIKYELRKEGKRVKLRFASLTNEGVFTDCILEFMYHLPLGTGKEVS